MDDRALIAAAGSGDRRAFDQLVAPLTRELRSFLHRTLAHPEDARDAVQEVLLRAFQKLDGFREESSLRTWLFSIATRVAIDLLRTRRRWPVDLQLDAERYAKSAEEELRPIEDALAEPGSTFDYREHVAFCFACVSRTLPREEQTALVLVDVYGFTYREAAKMSEVSEAVLRHRLSSARGSMQERFHGLCALVNKQGACYQCNVLREAAPEERRGVPIQPLPGDSPEAQLEARLEVVRRADLDGGTSHRLHDVIFRLVNRMVEQGIGFGYRLER
jgi:RNA polymerase sigma-70 factor, ECF subfamily